MAEIPHSRNYRSKLSSSVQVSSGRNSLKSSGVRSSGAGNGGFRKTAGRTVNSTSSGATSGFLGLVAFLVFLLMMVTFPVFTLCLIVFLVVVGHQK